MATIGMIGLGLNFFDSYSSSSFARNDGYNMIGQLRARLFIYCSHFLMNLWVFFIWVGVILG